MVIMRVQVSAMTPAELARGLDKRFEMLAGGRRRAVQRHQTLRAAIDWSFELCSNTEQRLLARLAVFAGGFDLASLYAVTDAADEIEVLLEARIRQHPPCVAAHWEDFTFFNQILIYSHLKCLSDLFRFC